MATHSSILAWRIPMGRGAWWATVYGVKESDMTKQLTHTHTHTHTQIVSISSTHPQSKVKTQLAI